MMSTETTETDPTKGLTDRKIAGMTDRDRILMMRTLQRQKRRVSKEMNAKKRELETEYNSLLENPIEKDAEARRRLEKMQKISAEIIETKRLKKVKVDKLEAAFDALLFPKQETTNQEALFPSEPVVRFAPEVIETMKTAIADVREEAEAEPEDGEEKKDDPFGGPENAADLAALSAMLDEMCASMGVAETSIIDEAEVAGQEGDTLH